MKKRLLFLMLSACILCAFSLKFLSNEKGTGIKEEMMTEAVESEPAESEPVKPEPIEAKTKRKPPQRTETTEPQEAEKRSVTASKWDYCYQCLDKEEQEVYLEIYDILLNFREDGPISLTDPEKIGNIFQCVLNDHPEIFYVQGYTYTTYTWGGKVTKLTLSGTYTMTLQEAEACRKEIDEYTTKCLAGIKEGASDYEKVKYIYEYLIANTEYRQNSRENQNICSVFLYKESVCQGYAKATQYLLNQAGVFATLVIGSVSQGEGHAWNLVKMEGNFYYVDTTWGDASYQMEEGMQDAWNKSFPLINYDYLGVTTEQLLRTHNPNHVVPLPYCVSMDCNYYVKEGTYLTGCDEAGLRELFMDKFAQNGGYLTVKCANEDVYEEVRRLLIEEQKIFEYIQKADGTVAYSDNIKQLSISFWVWGN